MSALQMVRAFGVEVALAGEKVRLRGLDRLDHATATRAIETAKKHRDQLVRELAREGTGLDEWPPFPPEEVDFGAYEAAGSLLDLCRRHGLRVVITDGKAHIAYPPGAPEALRRYADQLLAEGWAFIKAMWGVAPTEVHQ